ncbi:beta-galactosidase small subunit, partial [Nesterenkonia sp. PF2B19]|uniref:beta-galactosidase small subunit n=1 Tax=Nesterenkonia sp. PF2B19 TaxID=1881858 RepID=UPI000A22AA1A
RTPRRCWRGPRLRELAGAVVGPEVELWRAPTDNDEGASFPSYDAVDADDYLAGEARHVSAADRWRQAGLDRLVRRVVSVDAGEEEVTARHRVSAAQSRAALDVTETWTAQRAADGVVEAVCEVTVVPNRGWQDVWPRVGLHLQLPADVDGASWFGLGPHDSYPDTARSVRVGRFSAGIDELTVDYARPQESGHRPGLRELVLRRNGEDWLQVIAEPDAAGRRPGFTLSRHSAHEIAAAGHPHELPESAVTHLYLDAAQHGLGSRACGPDVWPTAMLRPQARTLRFRLRAL